MPRDELRAFENHVVQFEGWIETWTPREDGGSDVLIRAVRIRPYHLDETQTQRMARSAVASDHLWMRVPKRAAYPRMSRLDHVFGYGKVGWYTRKDGSVDLGLRALFGASGGTLADEVKRQLKSGDWSAAEEQVRSLCRQIREQQIAVFDERSTPLAIARDLEQRILPVIAHNRSVSATATRAGKGRAPRCFADLLRR